MRKLFGLLLAAAGIAFANAAYQNAPTHREDQLAAVTRILTNAGIDANAPAVGSAAPTQKLSPSEPAGASGDSTLAVKSAASAAAGGAAANVTTIVKTAEAVPAPKPPVTTAWQTSVQAATQRPGATASVSSSTPGDTSARYELVRSLQTELKRVGCYSGDITGGWNRGSKRALSAFLERVNAVLPVEKPDYIQLTLVQGKTGAICGRACPKGQGETGDRRCVPEAILARANAAKPSVNKIEPPVPVAEVLPWAGKPTNGTAVQAVTTTAALQDAPAARVILPGRMSVGAPMPEPEKTQEASRLDDSEGQSKFKDEVPSVAQGTKPRNAERRLAALVEAPAPRAAAQPPRNAAPKFYAPRPPKIVVRQQRQRSASTYRPRSVQNLFTHPLGRM